MPMRTRLKTSANKCLNENFTGFLLLSKEWYCLIFCLVREAFYLHTKFAYYRYGLKHLHYVTLCKLDVRGIDIRDGSFGGVEGGV